MKKYRKQIIRVVSLVLAVILLAGPMLLSIDAKATDTTSETVIKTGTTTASYLFIRSGPGTNYRSVGGLWKGSSVNILAESNGWYKVSSGWICAQYVKVNGTPTNDTVTQPPATSTENTNATITASALNIRNGPGTNYSVVGALIKGTRIQVLETNGNWLKIKEGWVSAAYVKMDNGSTVYPEPKTAVVTASQLNVRSGPSLSAQIIGSLARNQKVEVLETNGEWVRTNYGWVNKSYIQMAGTTSSTAKNTCTVTASALNVRSGPGTNFDTLGSLQHGQTVTILESKSGWYRVSSGWICADYVKLNK